jgi:hypothetical protein
VDDRISKQKPLWEGDQERAMRSGAEEQIWVVIHKCMEATLGISLYSHPYLKLAKMLRLSYYLLCFLFDKIREQEGGTGSVQKQGGRRKGGGTNSIYTCM